MSIRWHENAMNVVNLQSGGLDLTVHDLPSIPGLVADTLRLLDDLGASSAEIESAIMRDQVLAARVLRVVNSPMYGFSRRIESIREAVVMAGTRKTRGIAAAMLTSRLNLQPVDDLIDPRRFWAHSLACSVWATVIIDYKQIWHAQSAVMAALLHDLGIVVLCQHASDRYREVLDISRQEKIHHADIEQRELGTTHARVGATLCAKWMLPVGLTHMVANHHADHCPRDDALTVVMAADYLAHIWGYSPFVWSSTPVLPERLFPSLDISHADFNRLNERRIEIDDRIQLLLDVIGSAD